VTILSLALRYLLTMATILSFAVGASAQSRKHPCEGDVIPPAIQELVTSQFPGWRIEDLSDLSDEYQQIWMNKHAEECPGLAAGHFQAVSVTSYAALLIRSRSAQSGSKLVFFAPAAQHQWHAKVLNEETTSYNYETVFRVPPGKYSSAKGATSVRTTLEAFQMEAFADTTTLYYWRDGRFHTQVTSDEAPAQ
jgi:hypothetical protein